MIHNPCGDDHSPHASCMVNKNGRMKCRFDFPKPHQEVSSLAEDEKPNYRRRYDSKLVPHSPEFSRKHAIYHKDIHGRKITRESSRSCI